MGAFANIDIDVQELVRDFTHDDGHDLLTLDPESDEAADARGDLFDRLDSKGWVPPTLAAIVTEAIKSGDLPRAIELLSGGKS